MVCNLSCLCMLTLVIEVCYMLIISWPDDSYWLVYASSFDFIATICWTVFMCISIHCCSDDNGLNPFVGLWFLCILWGCSWFWISHKFYLYSGLHLIWVQLMISVQPTFEFKLCVPLFNDDLCMFIPCYWLSTPLPWFYMVLICYSFLCCFCTLCTYWGNL